MLLKITNKQKIITSRNPVTIKKNHDMEKLMAMKHFQKVLKQYIFIFCVS